MLELKTAKKAGNTPKPELSSGKKQKPAVVEESDVSFTNLAICVLGQVSMK